MKNKEYLYRYEEIIMGYDGLPSMVSVSLQKYIVISWTPKGAWILKYGDKKFVLLTAKKQFASKTKDIALANFVKRKERQISILLAKLRYAKLAFNEGREMQGKEAVYNNNGAFLWPVLK